MDNLRMIYPFKMNQKKMSASDKYGNVYFTDDGGESWIMHSLNGESKFFGSLSPDRFVMIKNGH